MGEVDVNDVMHAASGGLHDIGRCRLHIQDSRVGPNEESDSTLS